MNNVVEQVSLFVPDTWSGKTSLERSAPTAEKTSPPSLKKRSKSSARKVPLFLSLRGGGPQADASPMEWQDDGALLGEYTMHSFGECPSVAVVSRLSAILEAFPHPKYSLSAKACQGILTRAERRGKKLPKELERVLKVQANHSALNQEVKMDAPESTWGGVTPTLNTAQGGQRQPCVMCIGNGQANQSIDDKAGALNCMHDQQAVMVLNDQGGSVMDVSEEQTATLRAQSHGHEPVVVSIGNGQLNQVSMAEQANTLDTMHDQQAVMIMPFDTTQITSPQNGCHPHYGDPCHPLAAQAHVPSIVAAVDCRVNSVVRRLTPLECERLQGYPDGWTDIGEWVDSKGKKHKIADTPRYKALGNSIALPFWFWLLRRISAQYIGPATLGSLFDGIGGFSLCWERCNGNGTALWASEIEEFPMAVTRRHFGEEETM